ncbi:unnamed protein product, partial [Rotaria sordida]
MPEPNRPIEIRWLPSNIVKNEFEELLKPRWDRFSSKDCISGIRDSHQFDADIDGFISCRHISQSNSTTTHKFQIQPAIQSTISRTLTLSDSNNDLFIIIEDGDDFRLAQMHSFDPKSGMDIDNIEENDSSDHSDINLDNDLNSPLDYDNVHSEQDDAKMKLNQKCDILFCSRKTNQISDSVNEAYLKLKEWSNILLQPSHRSKQPDTLSSLDLSMDETVWILQHLRDLFAISSEHEQKRLMTMMPSTWGRDRIAKWFGSTPHQARQSIKLKSDAGIFSSFEDQRGNKPLDNEVQLMVHNFYTSDEVSRETSCKKQVIHPQPSRDPIPLRFLHLTIGETLEQFKTMYPTIKIGRSKFFALRPVW